MWPVRSEAETRKALDPRVEEMSVSGLCEYRLSLKKECLLPLCAVGTSAPP